jgi:hypothetical protein
LFSLGFTGKAGVYGSGCGLACARIGDKASVDPTRVLPGRHEHSAGFAGRSVLILESAKMGIDRVYANAYIVSVLIFASDFSQS